MLSRFDTCLSMPWMLDLLCIVTGIGGQFLSEARVRKWKKTSLRAISEHFDMPGTQLVIR